VVTYIHRHDSLVLASPGEKLPNTSEEILLYELKSVELVSEDANGNPTVYDPLKQANSHPRIRLVTHCTGKYAGSRFLLRMETGSQEWLEALEHRSRAARKLHAESESTAAVATYQGLVLARHRLRLGYESNSFQCGVAGMVILGLVVDMTEAQYLPEDDSSLYAYYVYCDVGFTVFFNLECLINMAASSNNTFPFVRPFFSKWLNLFDLGHALASIVSVALMMYSTYGDEGGTFLESFPGLGFRV